MDGALEPEKGGYSIEPFLWTNGHLLTWNDVQPKPWVMCAPFTGFTNPCGPAGSSSAPPAAAVPVASNPATAAVAMAMRAITLNSVALRGAPVAMPAATGVPCGGVPRF